MGPSPTIPTSFVPKQPVRTSVRPVRSGGNLFLTLATIILIAAVVGSVGVFAYERYLVGVKESKGKLVEQAQADINPENIEQFVRTRDRLTEAGTLLDNHVAASHFFDLLESVTLQSVRFDDLMLTVAADRSAQISLHGTARTFNALAAESSAFAAEKRIKSAIFSDIRANENGTVSFALTADIDPRLLALGNPAEAEIPQAPVVPVATSTPKATSTPAATPSL